jgi:hypothetical protein
MRMRGEQCTRHLNFVRLSLLLDPPSALLYYAETIYEE